MKKMIMLALCLVSVAGMAGTLTFPSKLKLDDSFQWQAYISGKWVDLPTTFDQPMAFTSGVYNYKATGDNGGISILKPMAKGRNTSAMGEYVNSKDATTSFVLSTSRSVGVQYDLTQKDNHNFTQKNLPVRLVCNKSVRSCKVSTK